MFYLPESKKRYYRYFGLLAVVVLGVVSILGTGGSGDSAPTPPPTPSVIAASPAQSSDTALVTTEVTAQFSENMDPLTINANSFQLHDSSANPIVGSVTFYTQYDGHDNVAVLISSNDLNINEEYFATITTEAKDTSGNPLSHEYNWSFFIAPALVPVSTDGAGSFGNTGIDTSSPSTPNATGEYIVFTSIDNLAGVATGGKLQIYRKNTVTGQTELVSTDNSGNPANSDCSSPRISDTGRYVVFASTANNLDTSITNLGGFSHIYFKDMRDGTISLLDKSINNLGQAGNGDSSLPDISGIPNAGSGKYVVFQSNANDLHPNDTDVTATNADSDIFLVNIGAGTVTLVSVDSDEVKGNGASISPRVTDSGQHVVFESIATNLLGVGNDTNGMRDIFLRDLNATTTSLISLASGGGAANGASSSADISTDGNFVAFQSDASNLLPAGVDSNGATDIFLRNISASSTTRLSVNATGNQVTGASIRPSISGNGQYVAFESQSASLVVPDSNLGVTDIFVRDKDTANTIRRISVSNLGAQGSTSSTQAAISTNGRYVSFTTNNNFDSTDFINSPDIYRAYNAALP
jgi:hypothetical protein